MVLRSPMVTPIYFASSATDSNLSPLDLLAVYLVGLSVV